MSLVSSFIDSFKQKQLQFHEVPQGDHVRGKIIFQQQCADCHYIKPCDDSQLEAPTLARLMGRRTGSTDYKSSSSLKRAGFKWNEEHLFKFLRKPQKYIPGNLMVWPGMKGAQERADLIAFIKRH